MKLLCVKQGKWTLAGIVYEGPSPEYGDELIPVGESPDGHGWVFSEYPHPVWPEYGWGKQEFVEIDSSIDESEMERNYQKEKTIV